MRVLQTRGTSHLSEEGLKEIFSLLQDIDGSISDEMYLHLTKWAECERSRLSVLDQRKAAGDGISKEEIKEHSDSIKSLRKSSEDHYAAFNRSIPSSRWVSLVEFSAYLAVVLGAAVALISLFGGNG